MARPRKQRVPSISRLTWTARFRRSWTRWSLTRTERRLAREVHRLHLLRVQLDSQLLWLKELEQRHQQLLNRQQEEQGSSLFHLQGQLPPPEQSPRELMDQLLGLEP